MVASEWSVETIRSNALSPQRTVTSILTNPPSGEEIPTIELSFRDPNNNWNNFADAIVAIIPTTGIITDLNGNSGNTKGLSDGQIETWFNIIGFSGSSAEAGAGIIFRRVGSIWYHAEIYKTAGGSFWRIQKASTVSGVYDIRTIASGSLPNNISLGTFHKMKISFKTSGVNCAIKFEFNYQGTGGYVVLGGAEFLDSQNLNDGNANNQIGVMAKLNVSSITSEENITVRFDGTVIRTDADP